MFGFFKHLLLVVIHHAVLVRSGLVVAPSRSWWRRAGNELIAPGTHQPLSWSKRSAGALASLQATPWSSRGGCGIWQEARFAPDIRSGYPPPFFWVDVAADVSKCPSLVVKPRCRGSEAAGPFTPSGVMVSQPRTPARRACIPAAHSLTPLFVLPSVSV